MRTTTRICTLLLVLACAADALADVLVETGPLGQLHHNISLYNTQTSSGHFQFLAGKFSLSQAFRVTSVEGYMYPPDGGLRVKLYSDAAGRPGAELFAQAFPTVRSLTADWHAFGNLSNWTRPAGTYWVSFEPFDGADFGGMPGKVRNPLASYAFLSNHSGRWSTDTGDSLDLGFRIKGNLIPEPGTLALMLMAACSMSMQRRRYCAD